MSALHLQVVPDASPFDLFISYSRLDNGRACVSDFVTLVLEHYREVTSGKELRVFFDTEEIKGMEDWRHHLLDGIRSTRILLVCLSPNYLDSEYCAWEFNEYLKQEAAQALLGEGIAPIYLVEIPGWIDKNFEQRASASVLELRRRQHFDFRPWFDHGPAALKEPALKALLDNLSSQIRDRLDRIGSVIDAKGSVDRHNEHFVGRTTELRRLREMVGLGKVGVLTVIHGLGGIGKTALAIEYAHAFAHNYPGGCWQVRCESREDLRVALTTLAEARDLELEFTEDEKRDSDLAFERVLRELKKRADAATAGRVLLLLDNVDQAKLVEPAQIQRLPQSDWLHLIATTRLGKDELFGNQTDRAFLAIDELAEDDALALIERYQPGGKFADDDAREAARDIVRLLGRFTLAVETAAVFLGQFAENVSCTGFRDRLRKEGLTGLEQAAGETSEWVRHGEKRLTVTLCPTLERLGEAERLALIFAALLPADHVALPWVRTLVAEKFPELGKDAPPGYPDPWLNLIRRLCGLRLLQPTAEPNEVRMHRLLQETTRLYAGSHLRSSSRSRWIKFLTKTLGRDAGEMTTDSLESTLLAHIITRARFLWDGWLQHENRWEIQPLVACAWRWLERGADVGAYLANQVAGPLQRLGYFAEAEPLLRRALAFTEHRYGPHHPDVAICLGNLALLLHDTNRLHEAEPLVWRALTIAEQSFGPEHPNVAMALNSLGHLLQATNRLAEAEPLIRRALTIAEQSFALDHPMVTSPLNNLAQLLQTTNRTTEAEPLMRRLLAIDEQSYGSCDPNVARDLNNLAQLLQHTNRLGEAEPLVRRALAIAEQSFGAEHPNVAVALNNLAQLLQATNRTGEAEPLMRRVLAINQQSFGPEHPNVAIALNNLAQLLRQTNRAGEAELLVRRALAITEQSFGPEHPDVAMALNSLAQLLQATNRLGEAEPLARRALAIAEQGFGPEHPNVAMALNSLAQLLQATNRLGEAEPIIRRIVCVFLQFGVSAGHEHPHLQVATQNYCALLEKMGRSPPQILAQLNDLGRPFGRAFGSGEWRRSTP